tara:strand:- start:320 stop:565 length:246 start_codon:yes stop_codon:yes gene_type:complete
MNYFKTKSTKRFSFGINRNSTAHKAGGNSLTISTNPTSDSGYSTSQTSLTMTVREAQALRGFLNAQLDESYTESDTSDSVI